MEQFNTLHERPRWQLALIGWLGFGLSGLLGYFVHYLLRHGPFKSAVNSLFQVQAAQSLLLAIVLLMVSLAIWGAVTGGLSGWLLTKIDPQGPRNRLIAAAAIAFALTQAIVFPLALLITSVISVANNNLDVSIHSFPLLFAIFGFAFGLLFGLIFGLISVGWRYTLHVFFSSLLAGTVGGGLIGALILLGRRTSDVGLPSIGLFGLLLMMLFFYGTFGLVLALLFHHFHTLREGETKLPQAIDRKWKIIGIVASILIAILILPRITQLFEFARMQGGTLASFLPTEAEGVAWLPPELVELSDPLDEVGVSSAVTDDATVLVWRAAGDVWLQMDDSAEPINVSNSSDPASAPAVAVDSSGAAYVVWQAGDQIVGSQCRDDSCATPTAISAEIDCASAPNGQPTIAIDARDSVLVSWSAADATPILSWPAVVGPSNATAACLPATGTPHLAANGGEMAALALDSAEGVDIYSLDNGEWALTESVVGSQPALLLGDDALAMAWCGANETVMVKEGDSAEEAIAAFPTCLSQPTLARDSDGQLHVSWYSDQIETVTDTTRSGNFVYESIQTDDGWTEPMLVSVTNQPTTPSLTSLPDESLQLTWATAPTEIAVAVQPTYDCAATTTSNLANAMLAVMESGEYRPADELVPYCRNQYIQMLHMPNPRPSFSEQEPTLDGGFDRVANAVAEVEYEALFATMEYIADQDDNSPGFRLATAVADLYNNLQANPEQYPRGLTVRILLGNYPDLGTMQWGSQLYNVLEDLREAGVPELVNEELGWKLEVANFDGQLPHSHTKFLVTDGKSSTAAGFNYSYLHLSPEHPSGLGIGLVDLGLQVHGPIAQSSLVVYDDMWQDADQVVCDSLNPPGDNWERHCDWQKAVADHVPEVLRYAASAEGDANAVDEAFSLYRSTNYLEADEAYAAAISQTEDTLDVFEVNFSLKIYCVLVLIDQSVCDFDDALPWMVSMVDAIEANQVQTRVLITDVNMNGMENAAGVMILMDELEERGLTEYIQIRTYTGRMHSKGVLMDEELLVVGSQNFHYSSWGNSPAALAEYNIATTSPAAIEEFQRTFEYYWEQGRDIADFNGLTFE